MNARTKWYLRQPDISQNRPKNNWCCLVNATKDLQIVLTPTMEYYICKKKSRISATIRQPSGPKPPASPAALPLSGCSPSDATAGCHPAEQSWCFTYVPNMWWVEIPPPRKVWVFKPTYFSAGNALLIYMYTTFECCSQHKTQQNTQESNTVLHLEPQVET